MLYYLKECKLEDKLINLHFILLKVYVYLNIEYLTKKNNKYLKTSYKKKQGTHQKPYSDNL